MRWRGQGGDEHGDACAPVVGNAIVWRTPASRGDRKLRVGQVRGVPSLGLEPEDPASMEAPFVREAECGEVPHPPRQEPEARRRVRHGDGASDFRSMRVFHGRTR